VEEEKAKNEDVNVQDFLEQLAQHGLSEEDRLEIVAKMREAVASKTVIE